MWCFCIEIDCKVNGFFYQQSNNAKVQSAVLYNGVRVNTTPETDSSESSVVPNTSASGSIEGSDLELDQEFKSLKHLDTDSKHKPLTRIASAITHQQITINPIKKQESDKHVSVAQDNVCDNPVADRSNTKIPVPVIVVSGQRTKLCPQSSSSLEVADIMDTKHNLQIANTGPTEPKFSPPSLLVEPAMVSVNVITSEDDSGNESLSTG